MNQYYNQHPDSDLFIDEQQIPDSGSHIHQLHALLRGRYHWAIILGVILATLGALAGYFSQGDVYQSTSLIAVSPVTQMILSNRTDESISRYYDSWIDRQLAIIEGRQVLSPAMASDEWQSVAFGAYATSTDLFRTGLSVARKRGQQVIAISYQAPTPELAQVGANVITNAYKAELERSEQLQDSELQRVRENHRLELQRKIEKLQADKRTISTKYSELTIADDLKRMSLLRDNLEAELNQTRDDLAELGVSSSDDPANTDQLTLEQLATQDKQLANMLQLRNQLESDIEYKVRMGMGEKHREIRETRARIATLNTQIQKRDNTLRGSPDGNWPNDNNPAADATSPILALRSKEKRLAKRHEDAKAETQHLAMIYEQMQTITSSLKLRHDELANTNTLIENLRIEGQAPGRAHIDRTAGLPSKPANLGKRKQLAALGGMAGLCAGFALVIVFGMSDRRLRHFEDAQIGLGNIRMLGVLPELPDDLTDPEQAVLASHCVHQIRTLLQIDRGPDGFILSVTGPAAGSGKTSLTMSLGMSFASSGSKTLMIDCDIVGGGLTRRMLDPDDPNKTTGVLEACNGTAFSDCVVSTAFPNLYILPIGAALPSQAGDLSPAAVRKLLTKARDEYDTILVDTGPVLGSLEAAMVSAQADKTIVIVSRGDQKPIVAKSLNHLRAIGANIAGVVFNHADSVDIERSTYASITVSQNRRQDNKVFNEVQWLDRDTSNRFGPLATAVASYGRKTDDNEDKQT